MVHMSTTTTSPLTPPSATTVGSSQTLLTEAREYLPDIDHAVFKHFRIIKRVEGKAQQYECKFCSNVYTGAAIRCAQHVTSWKGMKRREVMLCKDAPQDVRLAMRAKYEAKAAAAEEKRRAAAEAVAAVKANGVKRARITDYLDGDAAARKREADEALALAWAALHIPERHIDHPLMVNALNLVKRAGVDYVPPKRKYIGGAGLLSCRNGIEQGLVGIKASWKRTGVTVSSDMMTDRNGRPQANVLLVNDSGAVFTDCIDCNMERKTGGYVAGILRPVVEEVGPENVVAFCMDGGSNYAVAVKQLIREWPHIQDVPCATHVLDLLMEDVGKMGWAKPVVDKGGEISSFVRNHHWTRGYLASSGTRFGTNYIAISRLCAMRGSLTNMVTSEGWKEWAVGDRKKSCDGFSALIHDAAWWKMAEFFVALLKLPFKVMRQTDGHVGGMMGRLYDLMLQLTEDVGGLLDADEEQLSDGDKDKIRRILRDRWDGSLACAMHVAGRILNPANQEEDIFGTDLECTKVFKAFISQQAEFLASRRDGGDDACDILLELGDGLRAGGSGMGLMPLEWRGSRYGCCLRPCQPHLVSVDGPRRMLSTPHVETGSDPPSAGTWSMLRTTGMLCATGTRAPMSCHMCSSCEAEIYAGAMAAQELRWLTYLLTDLGEQPRSPRVLYVDNKAMIALCQEHRLEHRMKHIALRYFLARELQQRGHLRLAYMATRANTADVFTEALPPRDHQRFSTVLGLLPTLPHLFTA
ncbi:unnamed protein product [Closterium sp. NIES-53]